SRWATGSRKTKFSSPLPRLDRLGAFVRYPLRQLPVPSDNGGRGVGDDRARRPSGDGMSTITHEPITPTPTRPEAAPADMSSTPLFPVGTRVEVRRRFDQHWAKGFEVAAH